MHCYEGIAVTKGSNPFGPYNVYFVNANYNPAEPGSPYLLNDFAKIAATRDAFLLFYDEFPLNGAVPAWAAASSTERRSSRSTRTRSRRACRSPTPNGTPNPKFNVAIENMGLLPTPDGTCASDNTLHLPGITCWFTVIPAQRPTRANGTTVTAAPGSCWPRSTSTAWVTTRSPSSTGPA